MAANGRMGICAVDILAAMNDRDCCRVAHAAPRRVLASTGSRWDKSASDAASTSVLSLRQPAATLRPSTRMFLAALTSRSRVASHCGQVQDLTSRGLRPELNPNAEHSRLDGN